MRHVSEERGVAHILVVVLVIAVLVVVGLAVYNVSNARQQDSQTATESPSIAASPDPSVSTSATPVGTTVSEDHFTVTVPNAWTKVDRGGDEFRRCDGKGYYFEGSDGSFFDICVDAMGRDVASDATWQLAKTESGFNITSEGSPCSNTESHFCAASDGKFFVLAKGGGTLSGHSYYFQAGNTTRETGVEQQQFKNVLASFKVK